MAHDPERSPSKSLSTKIVNIHWRPGNRESPAFLFDVEGARKSGDSRYKVPASLEQPAHGFVQVDTANRLGQELRNGKDFDLRQLFFRGQRDAVGNDNLLNRGVAQFLDGVADQDAVRRAHDDAAGAVLFGYPGRSHYCAAGRNHVVKNHNGLADQRRADDVVLGGLRGADAPLVDDRHLPAEFFLVVERLLDAPFVRAQDHEVVALNAGAGEISERHRHRYEFNNEFLCDFEKAGMIATGINPETNLVEIVEIPSHPWFVGVQFHPEYSSTVINPHPLFVSFVQAALKHKVGK